MKISGTVIGLLFLSATTCSGQIILQKVSDEFWKSISDCAISYFKNNDLITGLEKSIEMCGNKLKLHFPLATDDKNELSNEISY